MDPDPLLEAAKLLGVADLAGEKTTANDARWRLRLASAVSGAADGYAMRHASTLAATTPDDPIKEVDELRFQAVGMGGDPDLAAIMWLIWTVRHAQTRVASLHTRLPGPELSATASALHAVHGLLSASVHRAQGDNEETDACLDDARRSLQAILHP